MPETTIAPCKTALRLLGNPERTQRSAELHLGGLHMSCHPLVRVQVFISRDLNLYGYMKAAFFLLN
jgi:hypothetical protein